METTQTENDALNAPVAPLDGTSFWPAVTGFQPVLLGLIGLVTGLVAAFAPWPDAGFVLAAVSGGCLGAAVLLAARNAWRARTKARHFKATVESIHDDPALSILTDNAGHILSQNAAAARRFGRNDAGQIAQALSAILPNAASVVSRQVSALGTEETGPAVAHETVVTPRGPVRLLVRRAADMFVWRIDEIREPLHNGDGIGLPMMIVSHADAVLSTNDAMRDLLKTPVGQLSDAFPEQPLVPGRRTRMRSGEDVIEVVPIILAAPDGRREVYAVPGLAEPPAASVAARAFESLPVASLHIGPDGQVLASNRQAQMLLGIGPEEAGSLSELVEGLGRPIRDWVNDAVAERIPTRSEVVRARKRSDECFLQIALSRITDATGPSLLAVLHDATELKSLEQQFVQSQKMQAVGELAGGVAHDFNNLLTAIAGHCDLLLLRHDQGDPDYGDLVQIGQNANRAASLVGQLLAFSRQQQLKLEIVDLRDTMADLMHLLNRLVGEKIKLTLDHDPALLPIRVDRGQLDQVIMNLVVNARDAMADGGEVCVETRVVHLKEPLRRDNAVVHAGKYVTIAVRDNGSGIPQAKLDRIFEPFFTTKEVGKGTGLGLSMAYGIIKQSGGYIFVDSEVGTGSTFTIYIPVHDEPAPAVAPPPRNADAVEIAAPDVPKTEVATGTQGSEPTPADHPPDKTDSLPEGQGVVLLVEDEAPVRAFAARALQLRGYKVVEAGDAEAALETLRDSGVQFDLFVTDVVMPGMDGPSWVREALRHHPPVKVIFVSGYSEEDIGEMSADIPNSVFLPKPFSLSDLTDIVARQLH